MQLITNAGDGHRAAIKSVLGGSREVLVAVAFLKRAGAAFLCEVLRPILLAKGRARVFVGTDFFLTEPEALQSLLTLSEELKGLEVFVGSRAKATFHPKTYAGFSSSGLRCLIGSANLTGGALGRNIETSIQVEAPETSEFATEVREMFGCLANSGRFQVLTPLSLLAYKSVWRPVDKARDKFEKAVKAAEIGQVDLGKLGAYYQQYLADEEAQADLAERTANRKIARSVQRKIARLGGKQVSGSDRVLLKTYLQDLMSGANGGRHLWPSDNIFRRAGQGLKAPRKMIALFLEGQAASKAGPADGYGVLREIGLELEGVGLNLVTEVLSTYAPKRYAVVNRNTEKALAYLGLTFAGASSLSLKAVTPARYVEIQGLISAVRDHIGTGDFPETDAFLNWIFHRKVRG